MEKIVRFQLSYFLLTIFLFIIEVLIAIFMHDRIIRPYIGDFLVVILIYCSIKSFFNVRVIPAAIAVLLFAYAVEVAQYFNFISWIGLQNSHLARVIMESSFQWLDILMYTLGILLVMIAEKQIKFKPAKQNNKQVN